MRYSLVVLALLLSACQKDKPPVGVAWDGKQHAYDSCQSFTPHNSSGVIAAIPNNRQTIPTTVDVIANPLNQLNVSICDVNGNCKTTPSVYIIFGHQNVQLFHAFDAGYVTYNINEIECGL